MAPSRTPSRKTQPLAEDDAEAVNQLIAERERIREMLRTERAIPLTVALLETYAAATQAGVGLRDQRSLVRLRLDASERTLEGAKDTDTKLDATLTGEVQQATNRRKAAGFALAEVARQAPDDAFRAWLASELSLRAEALIRYSLDTRLESDAHTELVAALRWLAKPMWSSSQALQPARAAVANHIAGLPRARPSSAVFQWLESIALLAGPEDDIWVEAAVAAIRGGSVPKTSNGSVSNDASIRIVSEAVRRLLDPVRPASSVAENERIPLSADQFARSSEPGWLVLLPLIQEPVQDAAALWRAFLDSGAAQASPLRVAIDRLVLDEARKRTDELERERDTLRAKLGQLSEENASVQARFAELEAGLTDARAQVAGPARPRLPMGALEAAAELLNELRRLPEISDRTADVADRLRRSVGLQAIATVDDENDAILPELFDFIGRPGTGVGATVLRAAWVAADELTGDVTLVSKGAIKFG